MIADVVDFTSGESGTLGRRTSALGAVRDLAEDVVSLPRDRALSRAAATAPPQRVLAVSVTRPERAGTAAVAAYALERSRVHTVDVRLVAAHPGAGKWQNLNRMLQTEALDSYDWFLIFDDDVVLPRDFTDPFLFLCLRFELTLAQPAHRHWSHAAWPVTRRRATAVARRTRFVEIGPLTAIHGRAFDTLLPFPDLRMGWGLDAYWAAIAAEHGWNVGVVDATPIRHTRPVAVDYDRAGAEAEARAFLAERPYVRAAEANQTLERFARW
jgi:hypothetical protein